MKYYKEPTLQNAVPAIQIRCEILELLEFTKHRTQRCFTGSFPNFRFILTEKRENN